MGGALGNPIDEPTQERINETIKDVTTRFATEFSSAYTQEVVAQAKAELLGDSGIEWKLSDAPIAEDILKKGILTKRGNSYKSWKERYFIAYNAKDNYKIEYRLYESGKEDGKLKGEIQCAGYYAREFTKSEIADEGGEAGILLCPYSSRRRPWYIRCPDDKERSEWLKVFQTACYKAKSPRDEDECIAAAFDVAIRNVRWYYWFWHWDSDAGTEGERLTEFVLDKLDREILDPILNNLPDGPTRQMTIDMVRKTIGASVKAACEPTWISAVGASRGMSSQIKDKVKQMIQPIVDQEKIIKESIVSTVSGTINPVLADKGSTMLQPILGMVFKPITKAVTTSATEFYEMMSARIKDGKFSVQELKAVHYETNRWYGYMEKTCDIVDDIYRGNLAKAGEILGAVSPYDVYNLILDQCRAIMHKAVETFYKLAKDVTDLGEVLKHTMSLLLYDGFLLVKETVAKIFDLLLGPVVAELILKPCKELVTPIQDTIESIPVPGLSTLLDLNTMLEDVIDGIKGEAINSIITSAADEAKTDFELCSTTLGIKDITI